MMTEHMYTPAGIRGDGGSAKFKGNDATIVHLLEQAVDDIDVDWDHGTVSYSESGYGEGDGYYDRYYGDREYYPWGETTESDLSLALSSWGTVGIDTEEMIPEDYWEDKEPVDETFEPTGNEGVNAERQYADEGMLTRMQLLYGLDRSDGR